MWFSRQEYWSGLPSPSPGDPPNPNPHLLHQQADSLLLSHQGSPLSVLPSKYIQNWSTLHLPHPNVTPLLDYCFHSCFKQQPEWSLTTYSAIILFSKPCNGISITLGMKSRALMDFKTQFKYLPVTPILPAQPLPFSTLSRTQHSNHVSMSACLAGRWVPWGQDSHPCYLSSHRAWCPLDPEKAISAVYRHIRQVPDPRITSQLKMLPHFWTFRSNLTFTSQTLTSYVIFTTSVWTQKIQSPGLVSVSPWAPLPPHPLFLIPTPSGWFRFLPYVGKKFP